MATIIKLNETESTNLYAQKTIDQKQLENGTLIWTLHQTAGRGQKGNSWESEKGKNITCSAVFYPEMEVRDQFLISESVALAVLDFFDELSQNCTIKWPNDIYFGDKKIAGILIEQNLYGKNIESCIVGIGINVNQEKFLSDAPNPVSLKNITGKDYDVEMLIKMLQSKLINRFERLKNSRFHTEYRSRLYRKDGYFQFADESDVFVARILDVENDGHLVLATSEGQTKRYAFKEVQFII